MSDVPQKSAKKPIKGPPFGHPSNPQPSGAAKAAGWARRKTGTLLAKAILESKIEGFKSTSKIRRMAANYFGIQEEDITVELAMHFKQIEKAIKKGDTFAYQAFMNRAHGMPKQVTEEIGNRTVINVNIEGENESAPVIPIEAKVVNGK